jgi:hypothetical protein
MTIAQQYAKRQRRLQAIQFKLNGFYPYQHVCVDSHSTIKDKKTIQ